jgi:hypothetical protein
VTDLKVLPLLILIGRPASGKSEIIDYLQNLGDTERRAKFHLGKLEVIDDFPMLWTWFEEDSILSKRLNQPRLHTDEQGYFKHIYQWDLLVERMELEYQKRLRDDPDWNQGRTIIIEFSRGSQHGGYQRALSHYSTELLQNAAILYVAVSYEESLRKNQARFNPERPDSILEHGLPEQKLEFLYREDDWQAITEADPTTVNINTIDIPYVVFNNEDDLTSEQVVRLDSRLQRCMGELFRLRMILPKDTSTF